MPELASWVEEHRLENATYHILTPYPGTPLFRQLEAEGRILHRDWNRYDTAHVVFRRTRGARPRLDPPYSHTSASLPATCTSYRPSDS